MNIRWPWKPDPETKAFVSDLNTMAFSSYTNQRLWLRTGHAVLAAILWALLTDNVDRLDDALNFVLMWCGFLTGKSIVTAGRDAVKRNTDVDYVAAKGQAKAAGAQQVITSEGGPITAAPGAALQTQAEPGTVTEGPKAGVDHSRTDDERGE